MVNQSQQEKKRLKLEAIREFHKDLIEKLGISSLDFNMKMPFMHNGRMVVGIFPSEFAKSKGLYFELVNRELEPTNPERTVYKIGPNNFYEDEYIAHEKGSFMVPLEELQEVVKYAAPGRFNPGPSRNLAASVPNIPEEDAPFSEMTIRDYMAIHTGKPVSTKQWLNNLIIK